tara:strand:- start:90 stop:332 length:243 start_codon:yes stop_codon:yes gene_type:complete
MAERVGFGFGFVGVGVEFSVFVKGKAEEFDCPSSKTSIFSSSVSLQSPPTPFPYRNSFVLLLDLLRFLSNASKTRVEFLV